MVEIVKEINDTNASYRALTAGDAKNTDLFLDSEHYKLFEEAGDSVEVRFSRENLTQAILFIASILPRKYDCSSVHKIVPFSEGFVSEQLTFLARMFSQGDGKFYTQRWNIRKDVPKQNGEIDTRFYLNGLFSEFIYSDDEGNDAKGKFTIRNYLAGGYSKLHIQRGDDGIFDVRIENALTPRPSNCNEERDAKNSIPNLQQIFFGTPGSGKSHRVKELTEGKRVHRTTFHPDSDYASFVGCYKPTMEENEIKYSFTPQVFTEAYIEAWKKQTDPSEENKDVYLVIEEINRGNCAQIFGDLFQLLDRNNDEYSDYRIKADSDLRSYLTEKLGENHEGIQNGELCLPPNLHILATMNTSDQSLFPMDSAFKRRWDWEYVPVDYSDSVRSSRFIITLGDKQYRWVDFLREVNERIRKATDSEDKQMGNFFIKNHVSEKEFKSKVMFYLWNEVCRDEYSTQNNFFRSKVNDEEIEFSFNDLYQTDGLEKLQGFMTYLGVTTRPKTGHINQTAEEPTEA